MASEIIEFVKNKGSILHKEYEITIEPLLLARNSAEEAYINHLWYTIIDQRRDVKNKIIPTIFTLLSAGFSIEFALENPKLAKEIITAVLFTYGHERKYIYEDIDRFLLDESIDKRISRTEAIIECMEEISKYKNLKNYLLKNKDKLCVDKNFRKQFTRNLKFIKEKSILFLLRDMIPNEVEPEYTPVPVDVNVFYSVQTTGLLFDDWDYDPEKILRKKNGSEIKKADILRIQKRIRILGEPFQELCKNCKENCEIGSREYRRCWGERIVELSRDLFLLGSMFCQKAVCLKDQKCIFKNKCMLPKLFIDNAREFVELMGGKNIEK
ncbi:MAG: hypothetical protein ACTSVK_02100 [Promethearchaeota archaeon]